MNIQEKVISTIRLLSVDMIEKAKSGHPGLPLGFAPPAFTLFDEFLKHDPQEAQWINRDRFVLSAGHGSALLYSLLHLYGYGLSLEDLKNFRQLGARAAGHPEYGYAPGIEATTGPLGQGIAMAVGMAMAEKHLAAQYNREDFPIIDHYTYCMVGDGCLQEGISQEAISLAGSLGLDKLIVLYDSNDITIEGDTAHVFEDDTRKRFEAAHWDTFFVADGNNLAEVREKIAQAQESPRPALVEIKTKIGYGSVKEGSADSHGSPIGEENIPSLRERLNWPYQEPFTVPEDVKKYMEERRQALAGPRQAWDQLFQAYQEAYPDLAQDLKDAFEKNYDPAVFDEDFFHFEKDDASRGYSGTVLNRLAQGIPSLFGGSADLAPSNKTHLKGQAIFNQDPQGPNVQFGIREHAMAAMCNGLSLHGGILPYCATFFVFSDYLKPAIRLSALMNQQVLYVFTHDSIGVGEDGPTHQPIEHLVMLRSIPGLVSFRPADGRETAAAYRYAVEHKTGPSAFVLSRQTLPNLEHSQADISQGAYVYKDYGEDIQCILIATGSELGLTIKVAEELAGQGHGIRVVSMPSQELFLAQDPATQAQILPKEIEKRVSVEALSTFGWERITGSQGLNIGIDSFGLSGKGDEIMDHFGFTVEKLSQKILTYLED